MEADGEHGLETPLLQDPNVVTITVDQTNGDSRKKVRTLTFKIGGITCASCATSIETAVGRLDGVQSIMVSPLQGQATVKFVPEYISAMKIKEAVEDAGFGVHEFPEDNAVCRIRIKGMACTSCSESVERALSMASGVKKAVVGLALGEAKVHYDPNLTDTNHIVEAIEKAGFGADLISSGSDLSKIHLKVEGIGTLDQWNKVKSSLEYSEGVSQVQMDFQENRLTISYEPHTIGPRTLIQCIKEADHGTNSYHVSLYTPPCGRETEREHETQMYKSLFLYSCIFSVPIFVSSMVLPMVPPYGNWLDYKVFNMLTVGVLLRWVLCTPVQFIIGRRFYVGSYHALRRQSTNMDVLVALGTNAAYSYSVYIMIKALTSHSSEGQDFFETSAMLISFILLGKYLEALAKGKTSDALAKLIDLAPETAYLLTLDGAGNVLSEVEISTQLIQKDDILKVVPGAKVPVDGTVINGQSHVNESMVTGEARPVAKKIGDKVIGGTVNENGCILIRATHVGSETALSQIVQLVEAAQLARAPVQKLADQISRFFVPTVVVSAFVTWVAWYLPGALGLYSKSWIPQGMDSFELALQFSISVLVVACPCALGLATPTAVMVATGKGASQGVLIKGGSSLEKAHKIKVVVFDKTGTLTIGKPAVVSAVLFSGFSLEEFCDLTIATETLD
ncbi:unnamed protein product [Cuscuta europaea]|uniref:P-type Cu(+) transporter n=1 Tax=Cuscuta europaea TaxID=41803 RepID=A0A9P0VS24_CUSEU|nr:unnamed protein product [Cuscuta europaea]